MKINKLDESLINDLNNLPHEKGMKKVSYELIKDYQNILRQYPIGTILKHNIEAGEEKFTKVEDGEFGWWEHYRAPWKDIKRVSEFDMAHWLAGRANITRSNIIQESIENMKVNKLNEYFVGEPDPTGELEGKARRDQYTNSQEYKEAQDLVKSFAYECREAGYPCEDYHEFAKILKDDGIVADKSLWDLYQNELNNIDESIKIFGAAKSKKLDEASITSKEPTMKFQGKSSHTFTKDKKWEVDFDEAGNIVARTRHGKPYYFKGHINDKVNDFPSNDEDNIILAAREQHGLKFGNKEVKEDYTHFKFTSGSNPYIAKDEKEKNRILKKYGNKAKEIKPGFYKVDDRERDLFRVDDLDEGSIPRNASRIRATDRISKKSMDLHKHGKYWRDDGDEFSYKAYDPAYLRKWNDIEVLETDPNYKPNRTKPEYVVQGNYGYGWEDLTASDNQAEARNDLRAYRENETGVPHRLITRRVPVTENLKEAFKPSDSGIQSVKCYNRYNYTIQELRVDNDNKTFERGNFTAGKADKKTKNRQEYEDIVDTLKELGYTEIKSDYHSMRNKSRKGVSTNESIKTFGSKAKKLNEESDSWLLIKNSNWYDPEGLGVKPPQHIVCKGTKEECTNKFDKIVADAKKEDGSRWVHIEELSDTHIKIYYPMAVSRAIYQLIPNKETITESSEGFQKEFYNDFVILKNIGGDGYDIYSYDGTPERVTKVYLEDEGYATLKDAKAEIDKWHNEAEKLDESKESDESELITQYLNNGEFDKLQKVQNGTNVIWKLKDTVNEASYGGAFDIADDQLFTREDIEYASEDVLGHINETFDDRFQLGGTWFENGEWIVNVQTEDGMEEYEDKIKIDFRKIRNPFHDLKNKYALEIAAKLISQIKRDKYGMQESLNESATEDAQPIETDAAYGVASVINGLIVDEYEAIEGYNTAIVNAQAEGYDDMVKVLTEIQAEENIHVGQLIELMKMVDPNADKIMDGMEEGKEQLSSEPEDKSKISVMEKLYKKVIKRK